MNVPAGKLGTQFQSLIGNQNPSSEIPLNLGLGGTFTSPKFSLATAEQKAQIKEQVKEQVTEAVTSTAKEKGKELVTEAVKGTDAQNIVNNLLKPDSAKKDSTKATSTTPVQDALKSKMQNLLKKKKKN